MLNALKSIQSDINTHIFRIHHEKQYECPEETQNIECREVTKHSLVLLYQLINWKFSDFISAISFFFTCFI